VRSCVRAIAFAQNEQRGQHGAAWLLLRRSSSYALTTAIGVIQQRAVAGPRDRFDHPGRLGPCFRFGDKAVVRIERNLRYGERSDSPISRKFSRWRC
jgi:hypothetical protein